MKNVRVAVCLMVAVLLVAAGQGFGVTEFKDGGTHNITSTIEDDEVLVDYQTPGMQTTVNLLDGGNIPQPCELRGYNDSRINVSGGSVGNSEYMVGDLVALDRTRITMSSGTVGGSLCALGNSLVTMSGGKVTYLDAFDSSNVTLSGGRVSRGLSAVGSSQVTISDGILGGDELFSGYLSASGNSHVTLSGGTVNYSMWANDSGHITMSGGNVASLYINDSGRITVSGGTIAGPIGIDDLAILTIEGSNFAVDGLAVGLGELKSILGGSRDYESFRTLTGTLANGDLLNNQFQIGGDASIVLIPEPATLLLLGLGGMLLRRR